VAAFSFCQDKIMTTGGEGGMLTTNDEELWRRAWEFKDHGKSYEAVYNRQHHVITVFFCLRFRPPSR
jgi:dTDP-4-amino-4,6-dideoxygalactose transaminase